jgi:thioredoxin-related protein
MKRSIGFCVLAILFLAVLLTAAEKTITIGECEWYTENNSFEDIVAIAKKAQKPILAVFTASWCEQCKKVKKVVFSSKAFKAVEKEAILLLIEETTKPGKEYVHKYNIKSFPTFKIFSTEGEVLESAYPGSTANDYLKWVRKVQGEQQYRDRLAKDPSDWEALFVVTEWQRGGDIHKGRLESKMNHLRKALTATKEKGPDDPNRQKAYERLLDYLILTLHTQWSEDAERHFAKMHHQEFSTIMSYYYPDKFFMGSVALCYR